MKDLHDNLGPASEREASVLSPGSRFNPYKQLVQIMTPKSLLGHLSDSALVLFGQLQFHKANDSDFCLVHRKTLACDLKCSLRTIDRSVGELKAAGLLKIERRGRGHENVYVFQYCEMLAGSLRNGLQELSTRLQCRFNPHKQLIHIMIPVSLPGHLSHSALVLYGLLQLHKAKDSDSCFVYRATLARELKWSLGKVDKRMRELETAGLLKTGERGRGHVYFLYCELLARSLQKGLHQLPKVVTQTDTTAEHESPCQSNMSCHNSQHESPKQADMSCHNYQHESPKQADMSCHNSQHESPKQADMSCHTPQHESPNPAHAYKEEEKVKRSKEDTVERELDAENAVDKFRNNVRDSESSSADTTADVCEEALEPKMTSLVDQIRKHLRAFFEQSRFRKPSGPDPAAAIAASLEAHGGNERVFIEFLKVFRERLKDPPGTWKYVEVAFSNWVRDQSQQYSKETRVMRMFRERMEVEMEYLQTLERRRDEPVPLDEAARLLGSRGLAGPGGDVWDKRIQIPSVLLEDLKEEGVYEISPRALVGRLCEFEKAICKKCKGDGCFSVESLSLSHIDWCECRSGQKRRARDPEAVTRYNTEMDGFASRMASRQLKMNIGRKTNATRPRSDGVD